MSRKKAFIPSIEVSRRAPAAAFLPLLECDVTVTNDAGKILYHSSCITDWKMAADNVAGLMRCAKFLDKVGKPSADAAELFSENCRAIPLGFGGSPGAIFFGILGAKRR